MGGRHPAAGGSLGPSLVCQKKNVVVVVVQKKRWQSHLRRGAMGKGGPARREQRQAKRHVAKAVNGPKSIGKKKGFLARREQERLHDADADDDNVRATHPYHQSSTPFLAHRAGPA